MKTFYLQVGRTRTDKFWVDGPTDYVTLSMMPKPDSIEAWLNGERMTDFKRTDLDGSTLSMGPLRDSDTVIVCYEPVRR